MSEVGELGNHFGLLLARSPKMAKVQACQGAQKIIDCKANTTPSYYGAKCGGQSVASDFASPYEALKNLMQL